MFFVTRVSEQWVIYISHTIVGQLQSKDIKDFLLNRNFSAFLLKKKKAHLLGSANRSTEMIVNIQTDRSGQTV